MEEIIMDKIKMNDDMMEEVTGGSVLPYVVQPGDSLNSIAKKYNVSMDQLVKWNNIKDPNFLTVVQQLKIKF